MENGDKATKSKLIIHKRPRLEDPTLIVGLTGWMDGGEVSTGTVRYFCERLDAKMIAEILPHGFYIYNFPASMELSSFFRPITKIREGMVKHYITPDNSFYYSKALNLVFFSGKEPNMGWEEYTDLFFEFCEKFSIGKIFFVGSVAGLIPHTREPHIYTTVSNDKLIDGLKKIGCKLTHYHGPSSIITYFIVRAKGLGIDMATLVAETPAYVQGYNPRGIEAIARCLSSLLNIPIETEDLRETCKLFEGRVGMLMEKEPELAEKVKNLEQQHDRDAFDHDMPDLKEWLRQRGIRP